MVGAVVAALSVVLLPVGASADHREDITSGRLVPAVRWAGVDRSDTAAKLAVEASRASIADPATSVVLATGRNFPDALAGTYLAGQLDAPILLTERESIPASTLSAITGTADTSLEVRTVYLLGGPLAIGVAVEQELEVRGFDVVRLAGLDRASTAAQIATGVPDGEVGEVDGLRTAVVARADAFPDALVAGAAASGASLPLLLTDSDALPTVTADALRELGIEQVVVAGGPVAVADAVLDELVALGFAVRRVWGDSRTETAVAFARFNEEELDFSTDAIGLARADDFPDALAFAVFAGRERISVALARDPSTLDAATREHLGVIGDCNFDVVYVPGGEVAVGDAVVQAARDAATTPADCRGVDRDGPVLDRAALTSLGETSAGRAEPTGDDVVVTALFDEPVVCTGDVPGQFSLVADDTRVTATSLACDDAGSPAVVVGFPSGSIDGLDGPELRHVRSGDAAARLQDIAGNDAVSDVQVGLGDGFVVTTTRDAVDASVGDGRCAIAAGGACSLRAAVQEANADPDPSVILVPAGTFSLTIAGADEESAATGDLDLTAPVSIIGAGAATVVEQTVTDRVVDARTADAVLTNLTITGGDAPGGGGGGIRVTSGDLAVSGLVVAGNTAREGGGLWVGDEGDVTVVDSRIAANVATGGDGSTPGERQGGGGAYNDGGTLTIDGGVFEANRATTGSGSGGAILAAAGTTTIDGATIVANVADRAGGGIEVDGGTVLLGDDVVIRGNRATGTNSGAGNGGGIHTTTTMSVGAVVVRDNVAVEGGGLWVGGDATLTLVGTEVIANTATGGDSDQGGGGAFLQGPDATLTLEESTSLSGNEATGVHGSGGGVLNNGGTLQLDTVTIEANTANRAGGGIEVVGGATTISSTTMNLNAADGGGDGPGSGGAIHVTGDAAAVTVSQSRLTGNTAAADGGGVWNGGSDVTIERTTIDAGSAAGTGGAIHDQGGTTVVVNATLTGNSAATGGAVHVGTGGAVTLTHVTSYRNLATTGGSELGSSAGGTVMVRNSVVVDAAADQDGACDGPGITSSGGNYAEASCGFSSMNDQSGTAPGLADQLDDRGVFVPDTGSPLVDATTDGGVSVDQLGQSRPSAPLLALLTPYDTGSVEVRADGAF